MTVLQIHNLNLAIFGNLLYFNETLIEVILEISSY